MADSAENRAAREAAEGERKRAYDRYACARYDQEIRNIYDAQDLQGQNMDQLNQRARAVEEQRRLAGCG